MECVRREADEQGEHTGYQIHSGYYHGSGMNQGRYRCRTFHGIRQPDVQREHGTLSSTTDEHQSQCPGQHHSGLHQAFGSRVEGESLHVVSVDKDTNQEAQVSKTGDDKGLLAGSDCFRFGVVETNKQIGRHTYQFPEHIHLENVGSYHQT